MLCNLQRIMQCNWVWNGGIQDQEPSIVRCFTTEYTGFEETFPSRDLYCYIHRFTVSRSRDTNTVSYLTWIRAYTVFLSPSWQMPVQNLKFINCYFYTTSNSLSNDYPFTQPIETILLENHKDEIWGSNFGQYADYSILRSEAMNFGI